MQQEDLLHYGLIPEFIGRVPVVVTLDPLGCDALCKIITEPKNALVKQYAKLLRYDGVEFEVQKDAIKRIAEKALERKTGARGLRSIFEDMMLNIMYEIPSRKDIKKVCITKETVDGEEPKLILAKQAGKEDDYDGRTA